MKQILQTLMIAVSACIFFFSFVCAPSTHASEHAISGGTARASQPVSKTVTLSPAGTDNFKLVQDSAFHRFFRRGKDSLSDFGRQIGFVYSNYPLISTEVSRSVNRFTAGGGFEELAKVILFFLLPIMIGFGVEMIANIPLKKIRDQLHGSLPDCFFQLIGRLAGRVLLELVRLQSSA
jgi:hypothetical protein